MKRLLLYLSQLRQIGRWSAEMILLFTYNRSNIWPIQDIGLLRGISKNYKKKYLPPESYVKLLKKDFLHIVQLQLGIYGEV
jgi:DNA-3-methyladenine glycosylase II